MTYSVQANENHYCIADVLVADLAHPLWNINVKASKHCITVILWGKFLANWWIPPSQQRRRRFHFMTYLDNFTISRRYIRTTSKTSTRSSWKFDIKIPIYMFVSYTTQQGIRKFTIFCPFSHNAILLCWQIPTTRMLTQIVQLLEKDNQCDCCAFPLQMQIQVSSCIHPFCCIIRISWYVFRVTSHYEGDWQTKTITRPQI